MARFRAIGSHVVDLSAVGGNVPDLSIGHNHRELWLELKFAKFKLRHSHYDDFRWDTMQRGQIDFLKQRGEHGSAICAILGYFIVSGDYSTKDHVEAYVHCCSPEWYLENIWAKKGYSAGAAILDQQRCTNARDLATGADLLRFIIGAAQPGR